MSSTEEMAMALTTDPLHRPARSWLGGLAAASLVLSLCPGAHGAPNPVDATPTTPVPAMGWGRGPNTLRSADARFIVMMIPHHQGAIAMAELAPSRSHRPEIKALAQRIVTSQSAEIKQMRQWYRQWYGTDLPTWTLAGGYRMGMGPGYGKASGMGMGMGGMMGMGGGMPGMGTSIEALKSAADFDRAFLEQMIPHHRMGVMMADHAEWNTQHPELRHLEAVMVQVQSQEIEQMAQWYNQWYGRSGG